MVGVARAVTIAPVAAAVVAAVKLVKGSRPKNKKNESMEIVQTFMKCIFGHTH